MKKHILFFVTIFSFLVSGKMVAQQLTPPQQTAVNKLFKTNKVVYFKFNVHSLSEIPQFSKMFSVDKSEGATVSAHADKAQFSQFIRINYKYTVLPSPGAKKKTTTPAKKKTTAKKK